MKLKTALFTAGLALVLGAAGVLAQSNTFTYQGQIAVQAGSPTAYTTAVFTLYNTLDPSNSIPLAPPVTNTIAVSSNGVFTTLLNFGSSVFSNSPSYLAIALATNPAGPFTTLTPLQLLTPTPNSAYAFNAGTASSLSGTLLTSQLSGQINNSQLANNSITVTAGSGLSGGGAVSLGNGVTLNNAGVTSLSGGGGVTVSASTGGVTLGSTPITVTAGTGLSGGGTVALGNSVTLNNAGVTSLTSGGGVTVSASSGGVTLGSSPITVNAGTGLSGGGSVALGNSLTLNNAGVTSLSGGGGITISASTGGVTLGSTATSGDTANAIVSRDGTGSFSAENITANGTYTGNGSNLTSLNASQLTGGTVRSVVFGGSYSNAVTFNSPSNSFTGNGAGLFSITAVSATSAGSLSTGAAIGAGSGNSISSSGATDSFVGGGAANQIGASSLYSAIDGGQNNNIEASAGWSVVAGGEGNTTASGWSVISGGNGNVISSGTSGSTIGGGWSNTNSANYATVPGGYQNLASGAYSFAAGELAQAVNQGAFVWADSAGVPLASTANNSVTMRASGGYRLFSSATAGVSLSAGSGSWSSLSDRNAKDAMAPVDPQTVLAGVMALPITQWSYKTEQGVRHLGPMAQDFHQAFQVGENDTTISTVDEEGVALAAIQGLNQKLEAAEHRIKVKDAQIQSLEQRVERLEKLISRSANRP